MAWVVDTCVLLDIRVGDTAFAGKAAECLNRFQADGLMIAPMTYVELAPSFRGDRQLQEEFLRSRSVSSHEAWRDADTESAHQLWFDYISRRRQTPLPRRPLADVLIAAFAQNQQGLITRNVSDFRNIAPALQLVDSALF